MLRRLIIMRHAKSDWANHRLSDHDRPLNDRGRRAASLMGEHFVEKKLLPNAIVASTATRVRETLSLLLASWPCEPQLFFEQSLYLASPSTLEAHVRGLHNSWTSVMLVGHNPGLSEFVSHAVHKPIELATAVVIVLEAEAECWSTAAAGRRWDVIEHWRPRELFE